MSTTNYDGRTLDLCIMGRLPYATDTSAEVGTTLDIAVGGQICSGIVKLMQKVLVLLLTYTYRYDPGWGTKLPEALMGGNLTKVKRMLEAGLPEALEKTVDLLRSQEYLDTPLDERIASLRREGEIFINYDDQSVSVSIRVTTLNGSTNAIIVPLRTNI